MKVKFTTNKGVININLLPEKSPVTVASFVNLVKHGYYDGLKFHRGNWRFHGSGRRFLQVQEWEDLDTDLKMKLIMGLIFLFLESLQWQMQGLEQTEAQFFITTVPTEWLNGNHTIFGEAVSDADIEVVKLLYKIMMLWKKLKLKEM